MDIRDEFAMLEDRVRKLEQRVEELERNDFVVDNEDDPESEEPHGSGWAEKPMNPNG
jgi:hypothetical protein